MTSSLHLHPTKGSRERLIPSEEIADLWRKHSAGLRLLVQSRFGGGCDCEPDDVVQDAFVRLAGLSFVPDDPLAWLARTVRNLAIDTLRASKRRKDREQRHLEATDWFAPDPQANLQAQEVAEAMSRLDVSDREILAAHLWNCMTFRQIAAAFEISSSTASRKYQSAIQNLRKEMGVASQVGIAGCSESSLPIPEAS